MPEATLAGVRVVDCSDTVAGQFATRLLADYGADVVLVEPAGGSPLRQRGPFVRGDDGEMHSLLFEHLNGGKASSLVPDGSSIDAELVRLAATADVMVVSRPELAEAVGADTGAPVVVVITDFAATGPYADWQGSELIHQALSGSMYMTGLKDREPLYGVGERASYAAGLDAYIAITAALHQRIDRGESCRRIDISIHEAAAAMEQNFSTQWAYNGTVPVRDEGTRPKGRAQCSDGWVVYFVRQGPGQWAQFCEVFQVPELADDPRFSTWGALVSNWPIASALIDQQTRSLTVEEVADAAYRAKLVLAPVRDLAALYTEKHLRSRDFWRTVSGASGDRVALGPVFSGTRSIADRDRPAPSAGGGEAGTTPARPAVPRPIGARPSSRPLEGVRVLDLGTAWAGPMASRFLALLGADVIKLEGPNRVDGWRGELKDSPTVRNYPDLDGGAHPYNRHAWFNTQNHGKRSVVLDIKQPQGLQIAQDIARECDVVVANWSPGALDRAGLGYETLRKVNPNIVVVEMPALGSTGPLADQRGLGPTMEAMAGIAGLIGYPGGAPLGSGTAYLDPVGALHGAAAVLTALLHRDRHRGGQHVEVAQREAAMHWIGEHILDSIENETSQRLVGNAVPFASPHGAFRARGEDSWIAIGVETDEQWHQLCRVLDSEELANDPAFATASRRIENREQLETRLHEFTRTHQRATLATRLQGAGVPSAPVHTGADLHADEQLRATRWFARLRHPEAGEHDYPGLALVLDGERLQPTSCSPTFGQHTDEVLRELLCLPDDVIRQLYDSGVTTQHPLEV
ncbi:CoA transferase [Blastococcus sp. SYSU DS1024]